MVIVTTEAGECTRYELRVVGRFEVVYDVDAMSDFPPILDPPDPNATDAAAASVFVGERTGMNRWTPKWGGKFSRLDVIFLAIIGVVILVIAALIIL